MSGMPAVGVLYCSDVVGHAKRLSCALAIGGLDPGGGAGIAADLRAFAFTGVFGCAALAVVTVQSTAGLRSARALSPAEVIAQAEEVTTHQDVRAIKTGALGSAANVRAVSAWLARHRSTPVIVDTVMLPTRGRSRLLAARAVSDLKASLIPRAWLVTANAPEAEALTGLRVSTVREARIAARSILAMGARSVLVKGGHLEGPIAIDVLATRSGLVELHAKRLAVAPFHGGGCILASLIAGRLASHSTGTMLDAVRWAKRAHHGLLGQMVNVGGPLQVLPVSHRPQK